MTYSKRMLIAVEQFINALLGGWPQEGAPETDRRTNV